MSSDAEGGFGLWGCHFGVLFCDTALWRPLMQRHWSKCLKIYKNTGIFLLFFPRVLATTNLTGNPAIHSSGGSACLEEAFAGILRMGNRSARR